MDKRYRQKGAVSLFAVIFAALLLTVLSLSFIKLMADEQQRATNNDLSQSAYDSALAGVEDAKRVINSCKQKGSTSKECEELNKNEKDCQVIPRSRGDVSKPAETMIKSTTSSDGEKFDQAYTCVNIAMDSDDYLFSAKEDDTELIPLRATAPIRYIEIEWFKEGETTNGSTATQPTPGSDPTFLHRGVNYGWGVDTPPLVRAQLIRPGSEINISNLDSSEASQTAFIRPNSVVSTPTVAPISMSGRARATGTNDLKNETDSIVCSRTFANDNYSCKVRLDLGSDISQSEGENAFLRLNTFYSQKLVSFRVKLYASDGLTPVQFNGVQPTVDSTGRASNLFRRVEARLLIGDDFPYPNYAADILKSICKNISVERNIASSISVDGVSCSPNSP